MRKYALAGMCVLLMSTLSASAHDYWLQPQQFFLSKGETTRVQLFVGDHFVSQAERPFQAKQTVKFQLISRNEVTDLKTTAKDGTKPVATITPKRLGSHLVVMERDWSHIEIEAAKFNKYLDHEGLSNILELRRKAGEDKTAGRERYRRYLKTLVQVEDRPSPGDSAPLQSVRVQQGRPYYRVSSLRWQATARCTGRSLQSQRRRREDARNKNR